MKLIGNPYWVMFKGVKHVCVPMSGALHLDKGVEACVHSGPLAICSFALLRVFNEKRDHIGNTFIHQGWESIASLKGFPKHTYQLQALLRAPSPKWAGGNTFESLREVLADGYGIPMKDCNELEMEGEKAKGGYTYATFMVDKSGSATGTVAKFSAFRQDGVQPPFSLF